MERLTRRSSNGVAMYAVPSPDAVKWKNNRHEVLQKLAEYEDLEEQGRLLKLPCKVGDTVYIIEDDCEGDPACCYHTCDSCNQRNLHIEKTKFYVEDIEGLGEYIFLENEECEVEELINEN